MDTDRKNEQNGKVVTLPGCDLPLVPGEVNAALVQALRDTLAMAESGQLQSFIGAGFTGEGGRFALWAEQDPVNVFSMLGSLAWLQHEYVHRHVENQKIPVWTTETPA